MYVVVAGAGRIGSSLATWILDSGYEVTVIDPDNNRVDSLNDRLGNVVILGDPVSTHDLEKAGISRADLFIATTEIDDVNLVSCQVAKHRYDVPKTAAIVFASDSGEIFDLLGVDVTLRVSDIIVEGLQEQLAESFAIDL
jgi:trk system potassium uptake protein TrkA